MPPIIDKKLCDYCGICYNMCSQDVFSFDRKQKKAPTVDCPKGAVSLKLPLPLHIVPSPALYGPPGKEESEQLGRAADFSRSIERSSIEHSSIERSSVEYKPEREDSV